MKGVHAMQAREYLGVEDPTQQSLQYVLESSAAAGRRVHGLPYLPTGNLVSGLPAALMSCCQARPLSPSEEVTCNTASSRLGSHRAGHACQVKTQVSAHLKLDLALLIAGQGCAGQLSQRTCPSWNATCQER